MTFPKFIIEGENLIIGKCQYHKQLATNENDVKGGGWYRYDDKTFTFYGESHDFGKAKLEDIKECVKNNKVFTSASLKRNLKGFKFKYDLQTEIIELN